MRKIVCIAFAALIYVFAAAQDTVRYGDSIYMFHSPQATTTLYTGGASPVSVSDSQDQITQPYYDVWIPPRFAQAYQADSSMWIYGVALSQWSQDYMPYTGFPSPSHYYSACDSILAENGCAAATMFSLDRETGRISLIEKVDWRYPAEVKTMDYKILYGHNTGYDAIVPAYDTLHDYVRVEELYFDNPIVVSDEFFVGFHKRDVDPKIYHLFDSCYYYKNTDYTYIGVASGVVSCLYYTSGGDRWIYFPDENDYTTYQWFPPAMIGQTALYPWGGVFPILYPREGACTAPLQPWQTDRTATTATLQWDTVDGEVQLAVSADFQGLADTMPVVATLGAGSAGYTVGGLEPERWYGAWLRRRCHWVTPTYDTLVWSPWTQVALFSTAAEGVAQAEQVGPRFSIFPNPVHDVVRVEAEVLPATLVLYDQQGRELYRTTLRDRQTTIGVGDLGRGVYHFSLTSTEGTVTKKLVVE